MHLCGSDPFRSGAGITACASERQEPAHSGGERRGWGACPAQGGPAAAAQAAPCLRDCQLQSWPSVSSPGLPLLFTHLAIFHLRHQQIQVLHFSRTFYDVKLPKEWFFTQGSHWKTPPAFNLYDAAISH